MPDWTAVVRSRLASLKLEATVESDLAEELGQHLEERYRDLCAAGWSDEEARIQALAELEDVAPLGVDLERGDSVSANERAIAGEARRGRIFEDLGRDIQYAGRAMRKDPLFVLFVVLTLALGIGANMTVFTVINTLLLNPLPLPDSAGLVGVGRMETKKNSKSAATLPLSYPDLMDYRAKNAVFSSLAGYTATRPVTFQTGGSSQRLFSELVTANYFRTLGLKPALGRFFSPGEDNSQGGHAVAVLNFATWQAKSGGARKIVGQTLRLNQVVFTVIGVAPPRFIGVNAIFGPDLWVPAAMGEQLLPGEMRGVLEKRDKPVFQGIGRLKAGVGRQEAQANLVTIASGLAREHPEADEGRTATVRPISEVAFGSNGGANGRTPILMGSMVLLGVVGIVLLIACSNVANLLLARSAGRRQEMAVRLALGASRGRLLRQLLTESVFLGLLAGIVGMAVGAGGSKLLWSFMPPDVATNLIAPKVDSSVFVFAFLVSLATGFLFGAIPAIRASRASVAEALKEETRTVGKSRRKVTFANALLVGQVALSFVSLLTAALFLRSIQSAYRIDPGFQTGHLAVFLTSPGQAGYSHARVKSFYKESRERVANLPGIESASWASNLPLWSGPAGGISLEGRQPHTKGDTVSAVLNTVDLRYLHTAGIVLQGGREFTAMDRESSTPVAMINSKMAHDYWPKGDAIGRHLNLPGESVARQIVGIAKTANYTTLKEAQQACVYVPLEQNYSDAMTLYVRTKGNPEAVLRPVQRELQTSAPEVSAADARTGSKLVDEALFSAKIGVALLAVFGLLALGLASIGLYGIMAYSVSQRKREIGLRMALGAAHQAVMTLILRQGMSLVLVGVLMGWLATLLTGRVMAGMLYGVRATDPLSLGGTTVILLAVALLACYVPARWATRVDPVTALREG